MKTRRSVILMSFVLALVALTWGSSPAYAGDKKDKGKITTAEKKAAAQRAQSLGLQLGVTAGDTPLLGIDGPGGIPHYFGPYGNYAYSPLPTGPVTSVTLVTGGTGYNNPLVTISDVYGTNADVTFPWTAAIVPGVVDPITGTPFGATFTSPFVTIVDNATLCGGATQPACGTGATATASIAATTLGGPLTGGIRKFVDNVALVGPAGANSLVTDGRPGGQYISVADNDILLGNAYYVIGLVEFYERMHTDLPSKGTRLRGYVQLESLGKAGTIPLTYLDGTPICYPGTLPANCTAGSVSQVKAVDYPHYLGPTIVANSNQPVRIKFYNLLPAGAANATGRRPGDLYIPSDETVMGAGFGPAGPGGAGDTYTQNRAAVHLHGNNTVWISDGTPHQWITPANETTPYPKGVSVFNVPDMPNPGRPTDLGNNPYDGSLTLFYTNAVSARLQFYHDHAMGITRLNVYSGEAAGYVVQDNVELDMINGTNTTGVNIAFGSIFLKVLPDIGIPLVIQDRTFVDNNTIFAQDPTWNWGTGPRADAVAPETVGRITGAVTGDLWYPHVYMSAQNPWDLAGANAFGRWHYGPWFINQTPTCVNGLPVGCIDVGPVPNPFYQAICDTDPANPSCTTPWEPPLMPGTPNPSMPGEAFVDTPMVNGTVYPYMEVEPRAYRFRVLNAGNDRFLNLQLYKAANKATPTTPGTTGTVLCDGATVIPLDNCTEVKMIPVGSAPNQLADTPSGIPDPATVGPPWIQIGTEGGFLPAPVVVPQQPIGWNLNPTTFNYGNVNQHSLLLGTAERADVVVDFTGYDNQVLILYNDAPAAFPAGASIYDFYTGNADQTDTGGAPATQPGYGPNTRTIMQIRVKAAAPSTDKDTSQVNFANLEAVFKKTATKRGVFEVSQDPILIPQAAYNSAYDNTFTATAAGQYAQLADFSKTFQPINHAGQLQPAVTLPFEMKAMHDEMGGVYDTQFGRMSGMLGLTLPAGTGVLAAYGFASPPTDIIMPSADVDAAPVGSLSDGTQIWRIFHNGVDTHPIHVHLFNAQLINRVGQDGAMLPPDATELGWKDTFRVNPLEVTFLAMRPVLPTQAQVPFEVPDSIRLIDPTLPEGATLFAPAPAGWFDPQGVAITEILNHYVNFGWEYVWHCHILAHEEMDMMHSLVAAVGPKAPPALTATLAPGSKVNLAWEDVSIKELRYRIERATNSAFTTGLTTFFKTNASLTGPMTFQDTPPKDANYWYRVIAEGSPVGDTFVYPGSLGFPTMTANSAPVTAAPITVGTLPTAPSAPALNTVTAVPQAGPSVKVSWQDTANNETNFLIQRCDAALGSAVCTPPSVFTQIAVAPPKNGTGNTSFVDPTVAYGNSYLYQVAATNSFATSSYTALGTAVTVPALPPAPTSFTVSAVKVGGNNYTATLKWASAASPTNFTIQRATNASFTTGLNTSTVAGNLRTVNQTITKNTTYYYRIRANNNISGSSAWTNALPFPIRTGP